MSNEETLKNLVDRMDFLEKQMRNFDKLVEFYKLKIPIKYKKAFPESGEDELFTLPKFNPQYPGVHALGNSFKEPEEIALPTNPKEYEKAKERMLGYAKEKDMIMESYYLLIDENGNESADIIFNEHNEMQKNEEMWKWIIEGKKQYAVYEGFCNLIKQPCTEEEANDLAAVDPEKRSCHIVYERKFKKMTRKILKPTSLEECPCSS